MNIDKFKQQHIEILTCIATLRDLVKSGIRDNAADISRMIIGMSSTIKLHLAVEDTILYPALQATKNPALARMGKRFQDEMTSIALSYLDFARRWNTPATVAGNPEEFRADANSVLKVLYERMRKEDTDFYPVIEAS
ncbi:hemerythrin domain-containing protein [Noviherbaspirillum autotrophicum]|uniref:Hemerythrin n=1 Tax=Noviherbaspirillum autotrophicum TaxID=709839 RepID=A0A0C1YHV3_9BURK|nr:hemerythrin domain-containing protein [Noviherbaspirillum autotrophicum]KIF80087.1 hemerythrin [Noviherbaspirillum autotrophicum]